MLITESTLLMQRLSQRTTLDAEDSAALAALSTTRRTIKPHSYLFREGDRKHIPCSLVLSGMASRHKVTRDGARQILSIHLTGDLLNAHHLHLDVADHSVQAMTELQTLDFNYSELQRVVFARPAIMRALWIDALVETSISREWILNVARRDARSGVAHSICELTVRSIAAGDTSLEAAGIQITQQHLGDAIGMTDVHVNRTLRELTKDGLIGRQGRRIVIRDWNALAEQGGFDETYLHLSQASPHIRKSLEALFAHRG